MARAPREAGERIRQSWTDTREVRDPRDLPWDGLADELDGRAVETVRRLEPRSRRFYADVQQYEGRYPDDVKSELERNPNASKLFVNMTRPKTRVMSARLTDVLFPTDDLNWDLKPAVQTASDVQIEGRVLEPGGATTLPALAPPAGGPPPGPEGGGMVPGAEADMSGGPPPPPDPVKEKARKRSVERMKHRMKHQLKDCQYAEELGPKVIQQGCIMGAGVLKGPVARADRKAWNAETREFEFSDDPRPWFYWVDVWHFFPDPEVTDIRDADFVFELHRMSARQLRDLAKRPDFIADNIRDILKQGAKYESFLDYIDAVRDDRGEVADETRSQFFVWEFHGTLERERLVAMADRHGEEDIVAAYEEGDPLDVIDVVVWFCQGRILKFGPHPLDSGACLYSVFRFDNETASVFRDGVPAMLRDQQIAVNALWRLYMQNSALQGVPMFIFDNAIKPYEGRHEIRPGKIYQRETANEAAGIHPVEIAGDGVALLRGIEVAKMFMDDETNLPMMAQGDSASGQTKTAHGLSILANAVNIIFRDAARAFDRDITLPTLTRLYEWNMQMSSEEDGFVEDMEVEARGSSVLLVRDTQAQNIMTIINLAGANPAIGQILKLPEAARRLFQALQLSKDEMVLTDEELAELAQQMAEQPNPEDGKLQIEQMKIEGQMAIEQMRLQVEVAKLAQSGEMTVQKILSDLEKVKIQTASKERLTAAEFSLKERMGTGI